MKNFNELHNGTHNISQKQPLKITDMDRFIEKLKVEDDRYLKQIKFLKWIYLSFIVFYSFVFLVDRVWISSPSRGLAQLFFILTFANFYLIFRGYHKKFRGVNYSVPLAQMLAQVVDRYQFRFRKILTVLPPVLFIDIALTLTAYNYFTEVDPIRGVIIAQLVIIPLFTVSGYIGYLVWKRKHKPLVDHSKQLLIELHG